MRAQAVILPLLLAVKPSFSAIYDRAITVFSPDGKLMQVPPPQQQQSVDFCRHAVGGCLVVNVVR